MIAKTDPPQQREDGSSGEVSSPQFTGDYTVARLLSGLAMFMFIAGLICLGYNLAEYDEPEGRIAAHIYYHLMVRYETYHCFALTLLFGTGAWVWTHRPNWLAKIGVPLPVLRFKLITFGAVLFALTVCALGTVFAYHDFYLCIDEYLPAFQAKIFARGKIFADVPPEWRAFAPAMTTSFVMYNPDTAQWTQGFLPVYAAIRALLSFLALDTFTGAILVALSLWLIVAIAHKLWPERPEMWLLAGLLLGLNTQVLIMGMTAYAWPAHLALNLAFVVLYLSSGPGFWVAPWIGFLAMGLHQPHVHPLFALPLVLRLALDRRWRAFCYYGIVYVAAAVVWYLWLRHTRVHSASGTGAPIFGWPDATSILLHWGNSGLIIAWSTPILVILAVAAWKDWKNLPTLAKDLSIGILITFGFYFAFPYDQGHGWGYRFVHGILGNLVLIAVSGWLSLKARVPGRMLYGLLIASLAVSLCLQLPARLWEVNRFVRPYALADAVIDAMPYDAVVIDAVRGWYSADLVRNDPFFEKKPRRFFLHQLSRDHLQELLRRGSARGINERQFKEFGIPPGIIRREK